MQPSYRFLCDGMLGKLCRKLRLLGFDAALNPASERGRFLLNADHEGRIAVTRSHRHHDRPGHPPIILSSDNVLEQIAELMRALPERPALRPFTRCLECNEMLAQVDSASVAGEIPPYVSGHFEQFHRCPRCKRIFWRGTHFQAMSTEIAAIESRMREGG
jgi:uncharacterized protein with PIN domain